MKHNEETEDGMEQIPEGTTQRSTDSSPTVPRLLTIAAVVGLIALLASTAGIEEDGPAGFLEPYTDYLSIGVVVLMGIPAVHTGTKWASAVAQKRMSPDAAGVLRVTARLVGYGLIFSSLVALATDNAAAALTMGSFAGLVAGLASQTVMGNLVAGLFLAIARPIGLGDSVVISGNSGTVVDLTLMHVVLDDGDRRILIPSSKAVSVVLVKDKRNE